MAVSAHLPLLVMCYLHPGAGGFELAERTR